MTSGHSNKDHNRLYNKDNKQVHCYNDHKSQCKSAIKPGQCNNDHNINTQYI